MITGREPLVLVAAAGFGLLVGSFLNVCIWRLPRGLSLVAPRSSCPACERVLDWWELVPVLSYIALGGRCKTCRARISPVYPLVEVCNALAYVAALWSWGWSPGALSVAVLGSFLIVSGVTDVRHQLIPDAVTLPGIVVGLVLSSLNPGVGLVNALLGLAAGGGFLLIVAMVTSGGMGGGDIKLAAMMGAFLGWKGLVIALLSGFVVGAVVAVGLMLAGAKKRRDLMPFGPFLALGGLIASFFGQAVVSWYLGAFWN